MKTSHSTDRRTLVKQAALSTTALWLGGCATSGARTIGIRTPADRPRPRAVSPNEKLNENRTRLHLLA
ncbi:MAG: hypothetical protein FJ388_15930 [Verrucomicrobia bacterium]|nr:hypothetical protein [Verrucomicrobiota bacterium]